MNKKIKYNPKSFIFTLPKNYHTQLHRINNKMNNALSQATAMHDTLNNMIKEQKKFDIKWKHESIKWDMKYSIFLTVMGIFLLYSTIFRWLWCINNVNFADWGLIGITGAFWIMACIIYRRRKDELKELFIDAI